MSFYEYVPETNTLYAVRGRTRPKDWKKLPANPTTTPGISHASKGRRDACVEIEGFLDETEHAGALGEDLFKSLLERCGIPFLYIGQGPFGLDMSEALKRDGGAKRADFLISFADLGHILVDVKVRRKVGFPGDDERFFSLGVVEIEGLLKLERILGIQVWIAFAERESRGLPLPGFWLVPVSKLKDYLEGVFSRLGEHLAGNVVQVRIPDELLQPCLDALEFKISWWKVPEPLMDAMAERLRDFYLNLQEEIENTKESADSEKEAAQGIFRRYNRWIQLNEVEHAQRAMQNPG
ncbi:MAG: hypothetical protein IPK50_03970 [Fibrobacterota bacterium]|nr:hypothetical protein [Fibrobacterota bacterium]QQS06051.1 MAG: hypothetical protein IPK50_03970 [Fibrobacterota bacterium]